MEQKPANFLVIGKYGQLASAFRDKFSGSDRWSFIGKDELNLQNFSQEQIYTELSKHNFDVLINCAAYTKVDLAESDEKNADLINNRSVGYLAKFCSDKQKLLVHFSTDYVYQTPDTQEGYEIPETENTAPLNVYGKTKLAGEKSIKKQKNLAYLIFRTSWVYSETGQNFVKTMLKLAGKKTELNVVADQYGKPTYAGDLATYSYKVIDKKLSSPSKAQEVYNICNSSQTNWCEFAQQIILEGSKLNLCKQIPVHGIPTSSYSTPAKRPLNNTMSTNKIETLLGEKMPNWKASLNRCLKSIQRINS